MKIYTGKLEMGKKNWGFQTIRLAKWAQISKICGANWIDFHLKTINSGKKLNNQGS